MTTQDIVRRVTDALERAGIAYMLTGSYASSYHGAPRSSQDIDVVIAPTSDQVRSLIGLFPPIEFYADLNAALEALRREGMFNIMEHGTGWKVDFIMRKSRPFSRKEFERRLEVDIEGMRLSMATAEDVLIAKLEWAKRGGSQRQIDDAAEIWKIRSEGLDHAYIEHWVADLGLQEQWDAARRERGAAG